MNWFKTKISYLKQAENGSVVKKTDNYLVNALSFTEAEARLLTIISDYVPEYDLVSCAKVKITDAVFNEDAAKWYRVQLAYVSHDEDSGKEKKINEFFMVQADNIEEALKVTSERMEGSIVSWSIPCAQLTDVLDVFPYEDTANHEQVSE